MRNTGEIFSDILNHGVKGLMVHSQLADYYRFLGLDKYADCHEKHFRNESKSWRELSEYYISHFNKLVVDKRIENPDIIPEDWYGAMRQDVDAGLKRRSVERGLTRWVDWETETKALYEGAFSELLAIGEGAAAMRVKRCLCDVDDELAEAQKYLLNKKAVDYDIVFLIGEQDELERD